MNKMKRILLIVLCLMLCTSSILIPASARTSGCSHNYSIHEHGNSETIYGSGCPLIKYYQCVIRCSICGDSNLTSHNEGGGDHSWDHMVMTDEGVYRWACSKCGQTKPYPA